MPRMNHLLDPKERAKFDKVVVIAFIALAIFFIGFYFGQYHGTKLLSERLNANNVVGYHCSKLENVTTLDEAKLIIEKHKERLRGSCP